METKELTGEKNGSDSTSMSPKAESASVDFLLQEYGMLKDRFMSLRNEGINRLNFFLTLTSAVIGGILLIGNAGVTSLLIFELSFLAALIFLAIIGLDVCQYMVTRQRFTDRTERGMNRIRRYFVERDPSITKFLLFPYHDEPTNYLAEKTSAGIRRTAQTVQSFIMGLAFVIAIHIVSDNILISIVAGLIAFIINTYMLERNAKRRLSRELTKAVSDIRFPKTKDHSQDMST